LVKSNDSFIEQLSDRSCTLIQN